MYIVNVILAIILLIIGGLCIWSTVRNNRLVKEMDDPKKWTLLKDGATITMSVMEDKVTAESREYNTDNSYIGSVTQYTMDTDYVVAVSYKYTYNEKEHAGKYETGTIDDKLDAAIELDKYKKDSKRDVYVNIEDPSISHLYKIEKSSFLSSGSIMSCLSVIALLLLGNIIKFSSGDEEEYEEEYEED